VAGEVVGESMENILVTGTVLKVGATLIGVVFVVGWGALCVLLCVTLGHGRRKKHNVVGKI